MLNIKQSLSLLLVIFLSSQLIACAPQYEMSTAQPNTQQCCDYQSGVIRSLQSAGVKVVKVGDTLTLVLPIDRFFIANSSVLKSRNYATLNQVAELLRNINKESISISGYTDGTGDTYRNLALSRQQAQTVADYLWRQGIDARLLSVAGYGQQQSVITNSNNRRVEIRVPLYVEPDDL